MSNLSESVFYGNSYCSKIHTPKSKLKNVTRNNICKRNPNEPKIDHELLKNLPTRIRRSSRKPAKKISEKQNTHKEKTNGKSSPASTMDLTDINYENKSKKIKLENILDNHDACELSEYEKYVQNNIAERMKFLEELNIFEAKKNYEESVKLMNIPKISAIQNNKNTENVKKITQGIKRKSLRLQHLEVVKSSVPIEINYENPVEEISLPSPGPAELHIYYKQENKKESSIFLSNLKNLKNIKVEAQSCWNISDETTGKMLDSLRSRENDVIKVVPTSVCSIAFHPSIDRAIAFVGGKRGELGIFDVENMNLSCSGKSSFYYNIHSGTINCVTVDIKNNNLLYTTSMDGSVRKLDLSTMQSEQIYCCNEDAYVSWHSQQDDNHLLVAGSYGFIDHVDLRCTLSNVQHYKLSNNYRIKVVAVNPIQNQYLSTGGADGNICLWDLRNMRKDLCSFNVGRTINGLEYTPQTGKYLLSTSYQDIRLFESPSPWEMKFKNTIRHNNYTGRWLRPFRASWLPRSENLFVIGSMDNPRRIEVWNADGNLIQSIFGDSLQSVSCVNAFHPFKKILLGGNSSGKVHMFT